MTADNGNDPLQPARTLTLEDHAQLLLNLIRSRAPFSDPGWQQLDDWAVRLLRAVR